jgi:hypothetical protein
MTRTYPRPAPAYAALPHPAVSSLLPESALRDLPEFARNDAQMALSDSGPLLATAQWPAPQAPSLSTRVYVYLPTSINQQLFFVRPGDFSPRTLPGSCINRSGMPARGWWGQ